MNETRDTDWTDESEGSDDGTDTRGTSDDGELDPRDAAELLEQARRRAERRLDFRTPWLSLVAAVVIVVALGAVWLSVRGQHPYKGPTPTAAGVLYGVLIAWLLLVVAVTHRAHEGVTGRSIRQQRAFAATLVAALVAVSVYQVVLKSDGASAAIVYGTYPLTAQLIVLGSIGAMSSAWREDWPAFVAGLAVVLVAAGGTTAGPVGVWLVDGIGCAAVSIGYGAARFWMLRR